MDSRTLFCIMEGQMKGQQIWEVANPEFWVLFRPGLGFVLNMQAEVFTDGWLCLSGVMGSWSWRCVLECDSRGPLWRVKSIKWAHQHPNVQKGLEAGSRWKRLRRSTQRGRRESGPWMSRKEKRHETCLPLTPLPSGLRCALGRAGGSGGRSP